MAYPPMASGKKPQKSGVYWRFTKRKSDEHPADELTNRATHTRTPPRENKLRGGPSRTSLGLNKLGRGQAEPTLTSSPRSKRAPAVQGQASLAKFDTPKFSHVLCRQTSGGALRSAVLRFVMRACPLPNLFIPRKVSDPRLPISLTC